MLFIAALLFATATPQPSPSLLVPRFDVGFAANTYFTVTNVSDRTQIVRVTIASDRGFNIVWYYSGITPHEQRYFNVGAILDGRPRPREDPRCKSTATQTIPQPLAEETLSILTRGTAEGGAIACTRRVGETHEHAIGYITIDAVAGCERLSTEPVLTGTFEQFVDGKKVASGALPGTLPKSITVAVADGNHDVYVWRSPLGNGCLDPERLDSPVVTVIHANRPVTIKGTKTRPYVWAIVAAP